jgi:hypothetical protein
LAAEALLTATPAAMCLGQEVGRQVTVIIEEDDEICREEGKRVIPIGGKSKLRASDVPDMQAALACDLLCLGQRPIIRNNNFIYGVS